jgi:hypothetical protein
MLLSEMVRQIKNEQNLVNDATAASVNNAVRSSSTDVSGSTTSTTYVLLATHTVTPNSGERVGVGKVGFSIWSTSNSAYAYGKITVQETGGSEITVLEKSTNNTSATAFSTNVNMFFGVNNTVYIRFYLYISGSGATAYMSGGYAYVNLGFSTIKTYNIPLSQDSVVVFAANVTISEVGIIKILFGSNCVAQTYRTAPTTETLTGIVKLASGNYTVNIIGKTLTNTNVSVNSVQIGILAFSDVASVNYAQYSASLQVNVPARKTCVGTLNQTTIIIHLVAVTPEDVTNISTNTNYVKILVDNVEPAYASVYNSPKGEPAVAIAAVVASCGTQHTISISQSNTNTTCYVSIVACPWILPYNTTIQPLTLNFPQGSTLYIVMEPLWQDPTKTLKLGKTRAVSFGDSTDYYSTASGTGVLSWNYTFESVNVANCVLLVGGYGGCISIIAVDVR